VSLVQVNYRVPEELREAINARAVELDVDASELARRGLEAALTLDKGLFESTARTRRGKGVSGPRKRAGRVSERATRPPSGDHHRVARSEVPLVNLPLALSMRTGMPKSVMERRVRDGRVSLNGEVVRDLQVPLGLEDVLALDGERV
jgi:hypothetical protein